MSVAITLDAAVMPMASCGLNRRHNLSFQRLGDKGVEETAASIFAGGEAGLQPVAQRYQFIDLGDDALLLCERRERESYSGNLRLANRSLTNRLFCISLK